MEVGHQFFLPADVSKELEAIVRRSGESPTDIVEKALRELFNSEREQGVVYISAPVSALMKGLYEENTTIGELRRHGNFGLGTFNDLDGEMVMVDGTVYQLRADGLVRTIEDNIETPFACVSFFRPVTVENVTGGLDYAAFKNLLYRLIPSMNMFYALRVDGLFSRVKVWSVSKQENYRPMGEVTAETFEYENVEGVIVGFYTPDFIRPLSTPGYHLHFLTSDRKHGGHLQTCDLIEARVGIQFMSRVILNLPMTIDYLTASLG